MENLKGKRNEKVKEQLYKIVNLFQTENIPKAIREVTFPLYDVPSNKWSLSNRLLMFFSGTSDARGFRQWKTVERNVMKGSKAVHILAPNTYKSALCVCGHTFRNQELKKAMGDLRCPKCKAYLDLSKIKIRVFGFRLICVFRKEDTEGKELEYENVAVPDIPLLDVAKTWGIDVKGMAFQGRYMGYYRAKDNIIALASPEEKTFFHELSHASQDRLGLLRKEKQNTFNEVTAELSALVLAELVGKEEPNAGATYAYIKRYIGTNDKEEIGKYLIKILSDVEKIVNNIIIPVASMNQVSKNEEELVAVV